MDLTLPSLFTVIMSAFNVCYYYFTLIFDLKRQQVNVFSEFVSLVFNFLLIMLLLAAMNVFSPSAVLDEGWENIKPIIHEAGFVLKEIILDGAAFISLSAVGPLTLGLYVPFAYVGFSWTEIPSFYAGKYLGSFFSSAVLNLLVGMTTMSLFYYVGKSLISFVEFFVTFGLIMRCISVFRRYGSTLFAIAVGLWFFLPTGFYIGSMLAKMSFNLLKGNYHSYLALMSNLRNYYATVNNFHTTLRGLLVGFKTIHIIYGFLLFLAAILPWPLNSFFRWLARVIFQFGLAGLVAIWTSAVSGFLSTSSEFQGLVNSLIVTMPSILTFFSALYVSQMLFLVIGLLIIFGGIRMVSLALGGEYFLYGIRNFV